MKSHQETHDDFDMVAAVLHQYFTGLYFADVAKLEAIFHEDAWLKAPQTRRSLREWLDNVKQRPIPAEVNPSFRFKVLAIDVVKDQAMAKVYCPLFDFHYIDFLGLLKEQGQWRIVNKMYVDLKQEY